MKDLKVIRSGLCGLEFVHLVVRTMRRLFMMAPIKKGRMLAPFTETGPHEKEMQKEEGAAYSYEGPRHSSPHIVGITPGS